MQKISEKWLAFLGIALLSFGCYLDYTVVNIALPTIQKEMQVSLLSLQWVMNIYFLALCALATIMGRLGDLFGRRRIFYIGTSIFGIASLIAGFAHSILWLILGRLLQGVGAAIVFPIGLSLLPDSFPENERGKSIAWLGSVGGIALALGPVLGGLIVTYLGWRWIFFINVPILFLGYIFSRKVVKESLSKNIKKDLDWQGGILLTFTTSGMVLGLIHSESSGWINFTTIIYFVVAIISAVCLIAVEKNQKNPLINFKDFSNYFFYSGAVFIFLAGALSAVALFFDPLYLQIIRNQSPQSTGFILFLIPAAVLCFAPLMGWLSSRHGIINTILFGLVSSFVAGLLHLFFNIATSYFYIGLAFICLGFMWAMGNTVPIMAAQTAVGTERAGAATGTMVTLFNMGGSIGLAIAVVVYNITALRSLQKLPADHSTKLHLLEKLISNPANALQMIMSKEMHGFFQEAFLQGFSGVMWFWLILSVIILGSVGWIKFRILKVADKPRK
jgi:EmrB/QacA subfamily drug resistance transporter